MSDKTAWEKRHAEWLGFVLEHARLIEAGKGIPPRRPASLLHAPPATPSDRPLNIVLCSPHPDDEALTGALPLRLRNECGARVTNCPITLGTQKLIRSRRRAELVASCRVLGFELWVPRQPNGLEQVNLQARAGDPEGWSSNVQALAKCFEWLKPDVIFAPHAEDWHPTHIGTHFLAIEALQRHLASTGLESLPLIETAYWHEHAQPNLMIGISPEAVATLVMATAEHEGEVSRNAYHVRLPSRLIENVRRGAETVGGQGAAAPDFPFADLYRVTFVTAKGAATARPGGRIIAPGEKIDFDGLVRGFR